MANAPATRVSIPRHKTWRRQFLITRGAPLRQGWASRHTFGGLNLYAYPGARVVTVQDRDRRVVGAFIGTLIDSARQQVVQGPLTFDAPASPAGLDAAVEAFAYRHGGSWLLLITAGESQRIYLDADGSMPLVYDPDQDAAAATVGLLLDDAAYAARFEAELYDALGVTGEGWFPSGLTAHRGISRLLCNHFLDLKTWRARRHWPRSDFSWTPRVRDHAVRVAAIARDTAKALLRHGKVVSALTGGNETRFLLAACRDVRHQIDYVTVSAPATKRDVFLARRLAEIAGVRHRLLPRVEASLEDQAAWHYRASHAVTGPNMASHPSIAPLSSYDWFVGGLGGEIGRAFFWRPTDSARMALTPESLVARFGMPVHEAIVEATRTWMAGVSGMNALTQLDLAYLELRMSAWAFAPEYADNTVAHIHPMMGREAYQLMLELPPEAKRGNALIREGIGALWPELMQVPINRYGGYRDVLHAMRRLSNPRLVGKKLRKLFG